MSCVARGLPAAVTRSVAQIPRLAYGLRSAVQKNVRSLAATKHAGGIVRVCGGGAIRSTGEGGGCFLGPVLKAKSVRRSDFGGLSASVAEESALNQ